MNKEMAQALVDAANHHSGGLSFGGIGKERDKERLIGFLEGIDMDEVYETLQAQGGHFIPLSNSPKIIGSEAGVEYNFEPSCLIMHRDLGGKVGLYNPSQLKRFSWFLRSHKPFREYGVQRTALQYLASSVFLDARKASKFPWTLLATFISYDEEESFIGPILGLDGARFSFNSELALWEMAHTLSS